MNPKNIILFIIVSLFINTSIFNAMENSIFNIKEINAVKNPCYAHFLENEKIAITNQSQETYIVNLPTSNTTMISDPEDTTHSIYNQYTIIQSNGNHIITCVDTKIKIYNQKTEILEARKTTLYTPSSLAWNPIDNTIFINAYGQMSKYNYVQNTSITIPSIESFLITKHPTQEIICTITHQSEILFYSLNNLKTPSDSINLPQKLLLCTFCQYNHDGTNLAIGNEKTIFIIDNKKEITPYPCIRAQEQEDFKKILFHPNNSVLAILCNRSTSASRNNVSVGQSVRYYDLKTLNLIEQTTELDSLWSYNIDFSQNGLFVVVTLYDKCVIIPVNFAIKKCIFSLWVLNQLKQRYTIPTELIHYILSPRKSYIIL